MTSTFIRNICLPIAGVLLISGCSTSGLDPLKQEIGKYGYSLYEPPRTNRGPGWTFRLVKTFGGHVVPMTVCENLYSDVTPLDGKLSLPNFQEDTTVDAGFAVELLEGLIKNVGEAKAELKAKNVDKVKITWGSVHSKELPEERKFDNKGKEQEIGPRCASILSDLKKRGELYENIFLVQEALVTHELVYEATSESAKSGSVSFSIKELLKFKPDVNVEAISSTSLKISEDRYVGFVALALLDWLPTGQLGPEAGKISGRMVSADEMKSFVGR